MGRMHFIGIGGTAMATLAAMLRHRGVEVQGSDRGVYPPMSTFLEREGIRVFDGYDEDHITADIETVVVGNAISRGNPELESVLDRKIRQVSLPEAVRDHFLWQSRSIVIAGTHGKTTTASMVGWLLTSAGRDPSLLVGGIAANFDSSYRLGRGRDFVIEGDEYDSAYFDKTAKFLKYVPDIVVVNNLEYDHADIYADMDALRTAFRRLLTLVPRGGRVILGADGGEATSLAEHARCPVDTFGFGDEVRWHAGDPEPVEYGVRFEVSRDDERLGHVMLPQVGRHNVLNALAAIAVGHVAGLSFDEMVEGFATFKGVRRRMELRGRVRGVSVFDDFAHHPTAIRETIRAVKLSYPDRRIWAVFEPRSATACRRVFQADFARAFADAAPEEIILASVFRSSVPIDERLSIDDLVRDLGRAGQKARHFDTVDDIVTTIADEARDGDLVVIMSNGGFGGIHDKLLAALGA